MADHFPTPSSGPSLRVRGLVAPGDQEHPLPPHHRQAIHALLRTLHADLRAQKHIILETDRWVTGAP